MVKILCIMDQPCAFKESFPKNVSHPEKKLFILVQKTIFCQKKNLLAHLSDPTLAKITMLAW